MSGWLLDERAHAGPEHLEAGYVAKYDAKTQLDLEAALGRLRGHGLGPDTVLVDVGCGTGLLAVAAASEAGRVVGVDPSPAMLEVARRQSAAPPSMDSAGLSRSLRRSQTSTIGSSGASARRSAARNRASSSSMPKGLVT